MTVDLNSVESITHVSIADLQNDNNLLDREELDALNSQITNQYIDFNNLGQNLLAGVEIKLKLPIFDEMIQYVNDNYTAIINYDETIISANKRVQVGSYIYQFIVVDCYNSILPNYLNQIQATTIEQFDLHLKNVLNNDASNFKTNFIKVITSIINQLSRLQQLDRSVTKDKNYQELLTRYGFYLELVNYGDTDNFLFNCIRPMLMKNFADILWRTT